VGRGVGQHVVAACSAAGRGASSIPPSGTRWEWSCDRGRGSRRAR
jgi:hypothetical protein